MKALVFIAATLLATLILVAAGCLGFRVMRTTQEESG